MSHIDADRPYQIKDGNEILGHIQMDRSPLYELPTRGGKTRVVCRVLAVLLGTTDWEMAFVVHRDELLGQAHRAMLARGIPHGIIGEGQGLTSHRIHICMIKTVLGRLRDGDRDMAAWVLRIRLMVPDEAHHFPSNEWQEVRRRAVQVLLFGVTATPYRADGLGLGTAGFNAVVRGPTMRQLQAMGYLAGFKVYAPPQNIDLSRLHLRGGDYDTEEMQALLDNPDFTMMATRVYAKFAAGQGCVVFSAGVKHAQHLAMGFMRAGWNAKAIDGTGTTPKQRRTALADLGAGRLHALLSCDLISEGVDLPAVAAAILCRPSWSTSLVQQQDGRPLTAHADKSDAIIVDLVGNIARHGMPDAERPWTLEGGIKGLERQVPATCRCPKCWRVYEIAEACPDCGVRQLGSKGGRGPSTIWNLPSIPGYRPERIAAMTTGDAVKLARTRTDLERIAVIKGEDRGWVDRAMKWSGLAEMVA